MSRRVGLRYMSAIAGKIKRLYPPAWAYDNPVGNIYTIEHGGYDSEPIGDKIGTADPSMSNGGSYDNR